MLIRCFVIDTPPLEGNRPASKIEGIGPENFGGMHHLNHAANRLYAMKHLIFAGREWRRYLQDHEVVSTYLRQDVLMIKQPHHKDLSE
jgi:hypothetical protein